jgi:uncharacterized protein (UPF0305 family)
MSLETNQNVSEIREDRVNICLLRRTRVREPDAMCHLCGSIKDDIRVVILAMHITN